MTIVNKRPGIIHVYCPAVLFEFHYSNKMRLMLLRRCLRNSSLSGERNQKIQYQTKSKYCTAAPTWWFTKILQFIGAEEVLQGGIRNDTQRLCEKPTLTPAPGPCGVMRISPRQLVRLGQIRTIQGLFFGLGWEGLEKSGPGPAAGHIMPGSVP
jgi:hypothetical protein